MLLAVPFIEIGGKEKITIANICDRGKPWGRGWGNACKEAIVFAIPPTN